MADVLIGGYLYSASGTINLTNGSHLQFGDQGGCGLVFATTPGSRGDLNLRGGSTLSSPGLFLALQRFGSGRISVTEGSVIDASAGVALGYYFHNSTWQLAVDGSGSTVNTSFFTMGGAETYLDITHGGRLNTTSAV